MKKIFLIFIITLLIFVGSSFMAAKEAEAQGLGGFGIGVMLNYGIVGTGGTPVCLDILFSPFEIAIGWNTTTDSLYFHGGLLIPFYNASIVVFNGGIQAFFMLTDPDMTFGFRIPIEAEFYFLPVPLCIFVGFNLLIPIVPTISLDLALSVGFRFYL